MQVSRDGLLPGAPRRAADRPRHEDDEIIFEGTLPRLRLSGVMVRVITRVITHTHTHTPVLASFFTELHVVHTISFLKYMDDYVMIMRK